MHLKLKRSLKKIISAFGLHVQQRDRLVEQIPESYPSSPFLPRINNNTAKRLLYFNEIVQQTRHIPGEFVECGVSIGHGLLCFCLLHELAGIERNFFGFDSFEGFPTPTENDKGTHAHQGYMSSGPEIVERVLQDGRIAPATRERLFLVNGFFGDTLPSFDRPIAILRLDCDLYESYNTALTNLYDRVADGGAIMFDEYEDAKFPGAKRAIDEFLSATDDQLEQHACGKYHLFKKTRCGTKHIC